MNFGVSTIYVIVVLLINIFLAFLLLIKRKDATRLSLVGLIVSISIWLITNDQVDLSDTVARALIWSRLVMIGPILIALMLLYFSLFFTRRKISGRTIALIAIPSALLLLFVATNQFVESVTIETWGINFSYGFLYYAFGAYFALYAVMAFTILISSYAHSQGIYKLQLRYVFLGLIFSAILASFSNIFLPIVGIQQFYYVGPFSVLIFLSFTTYAIVRHRLLDIRIIIVKSLVYFILIVFVAGSFAGITFLTGILFTETLGLGQFLTSGLVALIVVLLLDPIKNYVSRATDRIFFKAKIDYNAVLQELSSAMAELIEMDPLLESVARITREELKVESVLTIPRNRQGNYRSRVNRPPHDTSLVFSKDSELIKYLTSGQMSVTDSLERKIEDTTNPRERKRLEASRDDMQRAHAAVAAPIMRKGELTGVLFVGPKRSGDSFTLDELRMFKVLGPQLATALERARLFDEVKAFTEQLQQRVEAATKELRERNAYLIALQDVTALITRSFDFEKITQQIADAIANELGFLGGLLVFVDEDGRHVFPQAITQTPLIEKALKLLPKPFNEFKGDLYKEDTLDHRAIREGKRLVATKFSDVISPPVPKLIANGIQKLMGIRSIVLVPIFSEEKVVGAVDFALAKPENEITDREYEIMQALADQTGIAYRNWKYVERIREANRELEDANERLTQLDQAKTEFVSIASHQLRTPMTGIAGYLSMMVGGDFGKMSADHAKILKQLLDESQRMIRLINLFLNVSKIEAGKFELTFQPTQLEDVVEGEISELRKIAEKKGLALAFTRPKPGLPAVQADGDKLKDVILNLVDNAIKYTEKGSISVSMQKVDTRVLVSVKDTGIGIEPDEAKHLFQKFVRASGIAQIHPDGSGLGLFIAKKIVEAHGGSIWVESDGQNKGSTFYFAIPVKQQKSSVIAS